ncbi:MAG: phosphate acyltransferase PlsX [Bacillota bacterium]
MRVAVDAMGGDYAPAEVVAGAALAGDEYGIETLLVGDEALIGKEISGQNSSRISVVPAREVIGMAEHPVKAVRLKKGSSIVRAVQLVKDGRADAMVSAGNTGAVMTAALWGLGRLDGIDRPALFSLMPNPHGSTVLLDVGANVDVKAQHLVQFAIMGSAYATSVLKIRSPRVGILSIGEEETKGNELTLSALPLLKSEPINFIGNVEGRDVFNGRADVVVCDGFVGNVLLKAGEGLVQVLQTAYPALRRLDYAEYGGAPLLGVSGVVVVAHGSSRARAVKNAIRVAVEAVESGLVQATAAGFAARNTKEVAHAALGTTKGENMDP